MKEKQANRVSKVQDLEVPGAIENVGGDQGGKWRGRLKICRGTAGSLWFLLLHLETVGYLSFGETEPERLRTLDTRHG